MKKTINYASHEVLALATLLEVDYTNTTFITKNSNLPRINDASPLDWDRKEKNEKDLADMMKELWELLDEQSKGCIPSGIVFLPGKRLPLPGFGWAPSTWMSGQEIDHPDPLSIPHQGANLVRGKGLAVKFPGFLLHSKSPDTIFGAEGLKFSFPSDSTLLEWYKVSPADKANATVSCPKGKRLEQMRFAILLCRPKPREISEIALLVHIAREIPQKFQVPDDQLKIYEAQIICRVHVRREIGIDRASKWEEFCQTKSDAEFICGEELDQNQEWILDGYHERPQAEQSPLENTAPVESDPPTVAAPSLPTHLTDLQPQPVRRTRGRNRSNRSKTSIKSNVPNEINPRQRWDQELPTAVGPPRRASTWNPDQVSPIHNEAEGSGSQRPRQPNGHLVRRSTDLPAINENRTPQRGRR